jgi:diguanylate cyclase (GGDEF)-like protein/putative nucleotidyltransferase with HDIG domain
MNYDKRIKQKKVSEIITTVKLASLFFSGIILFAYYFRNVDINLYSNIYQLSILSIPIAICIITSIYIIWCYSARQKYKKKHYRVLIFFEDCCFMLIFLILNLSSGANVSQYKFLFLFLIITSTIESGMKYGLTFAFLSSLIILTIDLIYGPLEGVNTYFENDLILAGVFMLTAWPLGYYVKIENEHNERLANLANIDGLTGVYNHRFFHDTLKMIFTEAKTNNSPLSLILLDIDYFKYYNDLYGHQKGDEVLKEIGKLLKENFQPPSIVARYGGEEFTVLLPNTSESEAIKIAENIRYIIESEKFEGEEHQPNGRITASIGVSTFPDKAKNDVDLIKSADDALYRAKFFNKNRVESYYSILEDLKKEIEDKHIDLITSIKTLISVINAKDKYTYGHTERVVVYAEMLAEKLGLREDEKNILKYGAYLHDIGKINISKDILIKKMPLTNEEWSLLKTHPLNGVEIIEPVESIKAVIPLIRHHHERYDGKGYPDQLSGLNIPYLARILTVVDSFDAMTSNRPYNGRKSYEEAIEELRRCSGTQFDPDIVESFIEAISVSNTNLNNL